MMNTFKSSSISSQKSSIGRSSPVQNNEDIFNICNQDYFVALYEFSQGSSPKVVWASGKEPDNFMEFVVNTPPPSTCSFDYPNYNESHLMALLKLDEEITNVVSSFGEYNYIALYSQVLDCQARGFTRSIVLAIARTSPTIIKHIEDLYYDQLISIIKQIFQESHSLFETDILGYALSLAKTIEATQNPQLISKMAELEPMLPYFGVDLEKLLNEQRLIDPQDIEQNGSPQTSAVSSLSSSFSSLSSNPHNSFRTSTQPPFLSSFGEVKDPMFFLTIDNNLRPLEQIINFKEKIQLEFEDLKTNLPLAETTSAIIGHIDIDFPIMNDFKIDNNFENNDLIQNDLKKVKKRPSGEIDPRKVTRKQLKEEQRKKLERRRKRLEKRIYGLGYDFDFNFGDFKSQYSQLVANILHFNYDKADYKLSSFLSSTVFHHCAYSVLSGRTLVILSSNDMGAQSLADRLSLLSPFYRSRNHHNKKRRNVLIKNPLFDLCIQSDLKVSVIQSEYDEDAFLESSENGGLICTQNSISLHDCFKYAIVVTNEIIHETYQCGSINPSNSYTFHSNLSPDSPSTNTVRNSLPPSPGLFEQEESFLNILDLKKMVYFGEECPKTSFVMEEFIQKVKKTQHVSASSTPSSNHFGLHEQSSVTSPYTSSPALATSSSAQFVPKNQLNSSLSFLSPPFTPMKSEAPSSPLSPSVNCQPKVEFKEPDLGLPILSKGSSPLVESGPEVPISNDSILYPNDTIEISESESTFPTREIEGGISSFSGIRHKTRSMSRGRKYINPSDSSDASTILGNCQSEQDGNADSEKVFVLNMFAIINRKATQFVKTLMKMTLDNKSINDMKITDILKTYHLSQGDEPIYKYWLLCLFNKQKCRPVWNMKPPTKYTSISLVNT